MSNPTFDPIRAHAVEKRIRGRRIIEQNMPILQSVVKTYEFKPDDIAKLIAADLGLDPQKTKVEFIIGNIGDERFGGSWRAVTSIKVTVEGR